jgi:hypothetical protein
VGEAIQVSLSSFEQKGNEELIDGKVDRGRYQAALCWWAVPFGE